MPSGTVTQADMSNGVEDSPSDCAIAIAVKRATGAALVRVVDGSIYVHQSNPLAAPTATYAMTSALNGLSNTLGKRVRLYNPDHVRGDPVRLYNINGDGSTRPPPALPTPVPFSL